MNHLVDGCDQSSVTAAQNCIGDLGLAAGWVTAAGSRQQNPDHYNDTLCEVCRGSSLSPIHVLVPPSGTPHTVARFQELAPERDCKVARLCPSGHGYPLAEWVLNPLPELCERLRFSLILDFSDGPIPWSDAVGFARSYPAVPMVLVGATVGQDRVVGAALDFAPNLVFELSKLSSGTALTELASLYGYHRFVFGSGGSPEAGRSVMNHINGASLAEAARTAILDGTARWLASGEYAERYL